jgi:hypothetical protein
MSVHDGPPLYRTNDGRIVAEGDTDAAFLVVGTGGTIPPEYAGDVKEYIKANPAPDEGDSPQTDPAKQTDDRPARATKRSAGPSEDK